MEENGKKGRLKAERIVQAKKMADKMLKATINIMKKGENKPIVLKN